MKERYQTYQKNQIKLIINSALLFMIAFTLISFSSCGSDSSTGTENTPGNPGNPGDPMDEQGANEVWLNAGSFNVANLEVSVGTQVTWTNKSSVDHTVTSGTRGGDDEGDLFDRTLSPGQAFSYTFENAGSFDYFCRIHPGMAAEVTVTE